MWWLILASIGVAAASRLFRRRRIENLPDVSDEIFLRVYGEEFGGPPHLVIEERIRIAKYLGLPSRKLSPKQEFKALSKYTGFVGEYEVGMGDLEDELVYLRRLASMPRSHLFPRTVGSLIQELVKCRQAIKGD